MNETFITTPSKGEKLLLKYRTYKNILKEDDSPKEEATKINETNCQNYDVRTIEVTKLKKPQKKRQMVEIPTNGAKRKLNYHNAKNLMLLSSKIVNRF